MNVERDRTLQQVRLPQMLAMCFEATVIGIFFFFKTLGL